MTTARRLVVNADDFGLAKDVNSGIADACRGGILRAATLMANGDAFDHAVELARATPQLDIGCHLVLVRGRSLERPATGLPDTVGQLIHALALKRIDVYAEMRAQIRRILNTGLQPTHLDTHKHTHLLPPVLDALARLSEEFRIRWVRRPFDFPLQGGVGAPLSVRATSRLLAVLRRRFHRVLAAHACRTTDSFAGFQMTGRFRTRELLALIAQLPEGTTEFMCHPGYCTDELRAVRTRLKESRREELDALIAPDVRAALDKAGVAVVSYRDL